MSRFHLVSAALVSTAMAGCTDDREIVPVLEAIDATTPASVEIGPGKGHRAVTMPVRVVNEYGAAIPGTSADLEVSGTCADGTRVSLDETTVAIDESGYGYAHVTADCSTVFEVSVTGSGDAAATGDTALGYAFANAPPLFQMGSGASLPAEAQDPALVAAGTHGIALGAGTDIWWQSGDVNRPPHRVASLPTALTGMQGVHVDADGVLDLVAWGGSVLFLLRGVDDGGYTWQGGFHVADDQEITGVGIQDLDHDLYPDLAVGVSDGHDGWVEIVFGNGAWAWRTTDVLETSHSVAGVTADDENADGWADLTVLDGEGGFIRRWTQSESGWLEGAPPELIDPTQADGYYDAPDGSVLLPMVDLDHDGRRDIIVNEAPGAGNQQLVFFIMAEDGVTFFHEAYTAYFATTADMNQDGADDLLALEDGVLHIIRHDLLTGQFTSQGVTGVGLAAPLVAAYIDGDAIHDVAIVKDTAAFYPGELVLDEKGKQLLWEAIEWDWTSYQLSLSGPHVISDLTGDGIGDVFGFTTNGSGTTIVRAWSVAPGADHPTLSPIGSAIAFPLGEDVEPDALVRCGAAFYALAGTDDAHQLLAITSQGGAWTATHTAAVGGSLLACGPVDAAEAVIVASENGSWTSYSPALVQVDTGDVGTKAGAFAVADPDGDGANELVWCDTVPCTIAVADLDNDGMDEIIRGSEEGLSIEGWGTTTDLGGAGAVSTADVDDDGFVDVLAVDALTGQVLVFRGVNGGLAPAIAYHTDEEVHGTGAASDTSGDGVPEILVEGAGGTLSISAPSVVAAQ